MGVMGGFGGNLSTLKISTLSQCRDTAILVHVRPTHLVPIGSTPKQVDQLLECTLVYAYHQQLSWLVVAAKATKTSKILRKDKVPLISHPSGKKGRIEHAR